MRIGFADVFTGENGRDASLFIETVSCLESLGFSSYWASEHLLEVPAIESEFWQGQRSANAQNRKGMFDCLTLLATAAPLTTTLRLGSEVVLMPLREPIQTARQIATLDHVSGGRIDFGVGVGWMREEYAALAIAWETRGKRLDEYMRVMKHLWTSDVSSFEGDFVSFSEILAYPKPMQNPHPPFYVGGNSRAAARRVARLGDGWIGSALSPADTTAFLEGLDIELAAQGRQRTDISIKMTRPMANETGTKADWEADAEYVRSMEQLGVDEIICSHRGSTQGYIDNLREYASFIGI